MSKVKALAATSMVILAEIQKAVRELVKDKPEVYTSIEKVNKDDLNRAADLKSEIEVLEQKLKVLYAQYEPIRDSIIDSLPGTIHDKVEVLIDGIQLKTYPMTKGSGILDQEKAISLAKKKKILSRVSTRVLMVDENALASAVVEGIVTDEEYANCLTKGKTSRIFKIARKFTPVKKEKAAV